jgi:hypothetical protein
MFIPKINIGGITTSSTNSAWKTGYRNLTPISYSEQKQLKMDQRLKSKLQKY